MDDWYAHWFDEDYEALYAHRDEEEARLAVATLLAMAPDLARGPVLDLGCGSGRHLEVLRWTNPEAFGLDLSAHLLGRAPLGLRPWLLRGDMRRLPVRPGTLQGVLLWFTPFGYFTDTENARLLETLASLLRPGGALFLDYLHAAHVVRTLEPESVIEREGLRAQVQRRIEDGVVVKRIALERVVSGARREVVERVRLYAPEELTAMARRAGLDVCQVCGDYAGGPFVESASARWMALMRK